MKLYGLCIGILFLTVVCLPSLAQQNNAKPAVKVSGEVTKALNLELSDLSKMKHVTVAMKDRDGKEQIFNGVPVQSILEMAGVTTGKDLRGENLSKYVLVKCADGYEVLFSLAELDNSFTDRQVILIHDTEGNPLPDGKGPFRLIVPAEKKPARSAYQVTEILVKFAK
jgi:DMSO/TMAO reductase YedYZ molybdopterin-dependent catalytic subunit